MLHNLNFSPYNYLMLDFGSKNFINLKLGPHQESKYPNY